VAKGSLDRSHGTTISKKSKVGSLSNQRMLQVLKVMRAVKQNDIIAQIFAPLLLDMEQIISCKGGMIVLFNTELCDEEQRKELRRFGLQVSESRLRGLPML
jgi:hypothetical protein